MPPTGQIWQRWINWADRTNTQFVTTVYCTLCLFLFVYSSHCVLPNCTDVPLRNYSRTHSSAYCWTNDDSQWLMTCPFRQGSAFWRHVTLKGQGRDPSIFGAHYLDNGWRYGLGANEAHIGNDYLGIKWSRDRFIHFASAFVAVIFSQLMASSSALWRLNKPPSSFVSGHESTMCSMVWCSPQSQRGDVARPHLCILARHGPWPVQKRFNSVQEWRGRSKPGCWIVGSHTRWLLTTAADDQSSSHCALWSTGVVSAQIGRRAISRFGGWSNTSAYRGQLGWASISTEQFVCGWPTT